MRKSLFCLALLPLLTAGGARAADVGVDLNIRIGNQAPAPVPIIVEEPPLFLVPASLGFSVAVGVGYDMCYIDGRYYLLHGNFWHVSNRYNGPWTVIVVERLPPGLRKHKPEKIRYYRDHEYRAYQNNKGNYKGHTHRPEKHKDDRKEEKKGKGKGHS